MFLNDRMKPKELIFLETLSRRCELTSLEARKLSILKKGYEGEQEYDRIFEEAGHDNLLIYRDLWLKIEGSTLQIDSLIIAGNKLIVNEIKNYSGLYSYKDSGWFINGTQISEEPLAQAARTGNKLLKLRALLQLNFEREYKVVFVNPNFNLNIAPEDEKNIVQRSMLRHYMKELNKIHIDARARGISLKLKDYFIDDPMPLPEVDAARVKCGSYCSKCGSFGIVLERYHATCVNCNNKETTEKMIVRSIIDFNVLFHNRPMTKESVRQFVGLSKNERSFRRILNKYGEKTGAGRSTAYTLETLDMAKLLKIKNYRSRYDKDDKLVND